MIEKLPRAGAWDAAAALLRERQRGFLKGRLGVVVLVPDAADRATGDRVVFDEIAAASVRKDSRTALHAAALLDKALASPPAARPVPYWALRRSSGPVPACR
ncbi:MAG: hypothetical protein M3Y33_13430 [Actinomycetota bacterium]|nr:hypothetical protein [Actinomycetota bacterium]